MSKALGAIRRLGLSLGAEKPAKPGKPAGSAGLATRPPAKPPISPLHTWHAKAIAEAWGAEAAELVARRDTGDLSRPPAGLALSGGGIRSATFSLGILHALGAAKRIYGFDYLSTVSGGSYIGGFYCGLFAKRAGVAAVTSKASGNPFDDAPGATRQLREFGRYLAPQGTGDMVRDFAIVLRNLIAVHLVLGTAIMCAALLGVGARVIVEPWVESLIPLSCEKESGFVTLMHGPVLQAEPLLILLAVPLLLFVSLGWSFWLTPRGDLPGSPPYAGVLPRFGRFRGLITVSVIGSIGLTASALVFLGASLDCPSAQRDPVWTVSFDFVAFIVAVTGAIAVIIRVWCGLFGQWYSERYWDNRRSQLTAQIAGYGLKLAMTIVAISAADAAGYWLWRWHSVGFSYSTLALPPFVTAVLVPVARWLVNKLGSSGADAPVKLSTGSILNIAMTLAAILLAASVVALWSALAYFAAFGPGKVDITELQSASHARLGAWFAGLFATALCVGATKSFINQSALASLYAGRLRRAYLGAGNPARLTPGSQTAVDKGVDHDDIELVDYYSAGSIAPLHLINVTVNETKSKGSHVVQRDRHGRNVALTPAGIFYTAGDGTTVNVDWKTGDHERLPLSAWIGISGAAFSTGLGSKTNLRLAVLAGLGNLRLGYWWRKDSIKEIRKTEGPFATQAYLVRELTASFPGVDMPYWYLSDGGHFENTAAYELIRRKVPFIVVSDNGADGKYEYEDIANLVRKARIDFQCEIDFLRDLDLDNCLGARSTLRQSFGTLAQIAGNAPAAPDAVAALARLKYGPTNYGTLVLIKPRLTGDGPQDLMRYKAVNTAFPQQTTLDQFFDEDQWESYFQLGQLIGQAVFKPNPGFWSPYGMLPL